ncbi:MAG: hypothetical protein LBS49_13260 [Candidatus Accumulibacter sp.]|jgi:hypothetical protein|nr:hypothetical protein [Accumulibacter sp.]
MGILDWFQNRPARPGPGLVPDEVVAQAIAKAVALTNPRLKFLDSCEKTLRRPVEKSVAYLRDAILALPPPIPVSEAGWAGDPVLRAFFAKAAEVPAALARSRELRAFFDKHAELAQACVVLGTSYSERSARAPSLQGDVAQRDIMQTVVDFSVPSVRTCARTDAELRHFLGVQSFEYLAAQAMTEIAETREGRRGLEDNHSLIRARLRLLQQQGAASGSLFDAPESIEQRQLENRLLENERQMEARGNARAVLEYELECLRKVLENPEDYLGFENKRLRLSTLNVIMDEGSADAASDVAFTLLNLSGVPKARYAFVIGCLGRSDAPRVKLDLANAERLL